MRKAPASRSLSLTRRVLATRSTTRPGSTLAHHPRAPFADMTISFGEIVGFLERQYDDILAEESRIKRNPRFRDNRVHVLLYFITPTGHGCVECAGCLHTC